jgi:hypothetical protein
MREGSGRNNELFRQLGREARYCDDFDQLLDRARTLNEGCAEPMPDGEVATITRSIWRNFARALAGSGGYRSRVTDNS